MASDIHADGTNLIWKCMNCGTATIAVVLVTLEKSTIPNAKASKYHAIIPKNNDPNLKIPFVKLLKIRTIPNVQRATTQFFILPNSFDPAPPAMYFIAVG